MFLKSKKCYSEFWILIFDKSRGATIIVSWVEDSISFIAAMAHPVLQPAMFRGKVSLGTSIIATTFKDGIVMAADTRTSAGVYVVDRHTDKVKQLTSNIFVCESGSAVESRCYYTRCLLSNANYRIHQWFIALRPNTNRRTQKRSQIMWRCTWTISRWRLMNRLESKQRPNWSLASFIRTRTTWWRPWLWPDTINTTKGPFTHSVWAELWWNKSGRSAAADPRLFTDIVIRRGRRTWNGKRQWNGAKEVCSIPLYCAHNILALFAMCGHPLCYRVSTALTRATFRDGWSGGFVRICVITKDGAVRSSHKVDIEYDHLKGDLWS